MTATLTLTLPLAGHEADGAMGFVLGSTGRLTGLMGTTALTPLPLPAPPATDSGTPVPAPSVGTAPMPPAAASPPAPAPPRTAWPVLKMPEVADGAMVEIGTGPVTIELMLSNDPQPTAPRCQFAVLIDGRPVAGPLTVSSWQGMSKRDNQIFRISGDFPPLTASTRITLAPAGNGLQDLWVNGVSYNFVPLVTNAPSTSSRGGPAFVNAPVAWLNTGNAIDFGLPVAVAAIPPGPPPPPPAPEATPSVITGATINGAGQPPGTLAALLAAVPAGATLTLPAGHFVGSGVTSTACAVEGAGPGKTILDGMDGAAVAHLVHDKAIIVVGVSGLIVRNMTIQGARISNEMGANACAVRQDGPGIDFTLENVEVTKCQNGVLAFPAHVTMHGCNFHDNGDGSGGGGATHEFYGGSGGDFTADNSTFTAGVRASHGFKSRGKKTTLTKCVISSNNEDPTPGADFAGSAVDIPEGGEVNMEGSTIVLRAGSKNTNMFFYGADGPKWNTADTTLNLRGVTFRNQNGGACTVANRITTFGISIDVTGAVFEGVKPTFTGFKEVIGMAA